MSKLFGHLETKHGKKPLGYTSLRQEYWYSTPSKEPLVFCPLVKVNDLEFIVNAESYGENIVMFWISLNGSAKEANQFEYTLKLWNKDGTKILALKKTECLSAAMSRDNVMRDATALLLTWDDMKKAETDEKRVNWSVLIQKK